MFGDIGTSIVRTVVPIVAGAIITFFASKGINFDDSFKANLLLLLQSLFTALYYIVVRAIETRYPKAGWLLGSTKTPEYTDPAK